MAFALIQLGYNVLVAEPWYFFWTADDRFCQLRYLLAEVDRRDQAIQRCELVIGGNTTMMVPHPRTKELLHRAAGVPAINYWWDETAVRAPRRRCAGCGGYSLEDYVSAIRDERTLNIFGDKDVAEEWQQFMHLTNAAHVPLATTPQFWQFAKTPLALRPRKLCFLGNKHNEAEWENQRDKPVACGWSGAGAARQKLDDPGSSSDGAMRASGGESAEPTCRRSISSLTRPRRHCRRSSTGGMYWGRCCWAIFAMASSKRLPEEDWGKDFTLIGKGWDRVGLQAQQEHSGIPAAGGFYASSQASLNLVGGSVHGGMLVAALRRDPHAAMGCSLRSTTANCPSYLSREKSAVAFRNVEQMLESARSNPRQTGRQNLMPSWQRRA